MEYMPGKGGGMERVHGNLLYEMHANEELMWYIVDCSWYMHSVFSLGEEK